MNLDLMERLEFQAGGQFYPVLTGRLDSTSAFPKLVAGALPGPDFNISQAVNFFAKKGFNPREMVALLGNMSSSSSKIIFISKAGLVSYLEILRAYDCYFTVLVSDNML